MIVAISNAGRVGTTRFPIGRRDVVLFHLMIEKMPPRRFLANGAMGAMGWAAGATL
jgi:hypothetical protein